MAINPGILVAAITSAVTAVMQTDYKSLVDQALKDIAAKGSDSLLVIKLKMRDADSSDYWPVWLVLMMFAGFALTIEAQKVAQWLHIDALQQMADFLFNGGMITNAIWHGEIWRGVTGAFLHAGWFHICSNCLAFLFAAYMVNHCFKGRGWLYIFFGSQFLGSLATTAIDPTTQAVGASVGLMGLFGAMVAAQIRYFWVKPNGRPASNLMSLQSLIFQLALQLGIEHLIPNVGHTAHATGLAFGLLLGFLLPINAGMAIYATRKGIAEVCGFQTKKRTGGREYVETLDVKIQPAFDREHDAIYELKMSRNWRNKVSYVTSLIAGSADAITNRDFVRIANRYKVVDRKIAGAEVVVVKDDEEQEEKNRVVLPGYLRLGVFALSCCAWYYVYAHWFSEIVLDKAGLQWLDFLPHSVAPTVIDIVSHGGGILMAGIIAQIAHAILKSIVRRIYEAQVNKAKRAKEAPTNA